MGRPPTSLHHPVYVLQNPGSLSAWPRVLRKDQLAKATAIRPLPGHPSRWGLRQWTAGPLPSRGVHNGDWPLGEQEGASSHTHGRPLQQPGLSSLGVVRVDGVEETLQFCLVEDTICKEELELLQGQLPIICKDGKREESSRCLSLRTAPNPDDSHTKSTPVSESLPTQRTPKLTGKLQFRDSMTHSADSPTHRPTPI